ALDLLDARLLQERECATAGTDEDEARAGHGGSAADRVARTDGPQAVAAALEACDLALKGQLGAVVSQVGEQRPRQGTEVDIRTTDDTGRRDRLRLRPAGKEERGPGADDGRVIRELHVIEE